MLKDLRRTKREAPHASVRDLSIPVQYQADFRNLSMKSTVFCMSSRDTAL